jgi:hypothetical protein
MLKLFSKLGTVRMLYAPIEEEINVDIAGRSQVV